MSSGATMPARAPPSIDMLQIVMRPSIESARIADPRYSITWPTPPPVPMRLMMPRMMSFALTPSGRSPSTVTAIVFAGMLRKGLRREHVLDLARADAERERAEGAVGRRVRVAADDRHAGLRVAHLGTDHVHDALAGGAPGIERDAELVGVGLQRLHLLRADLVGHRAVGRRHVVVHRRDREVGAANGAIVHAQALERLRARHLVHEMQVDVEEVGLAVGAMHDMAFPYLLSQRLGHGVRLDLHRAMYGLLPLFHYLELSSAIWNRRGRRYQVDDPTSEERQADVRLALRARDREQLQWFRRERSARAGPAGA